MRSRARRAYVARGAPSDAAERAARAIAGVPPEHVLWVGAEAPEPHVATPISAARRALGRSAHVVVLGAAASSDPDLLGCAQGMVLGGGALILLRPDEPPSTPFERRLERALAEAPFEPMPARVDVSPARPTGTREQADLVARLGARLSSTEPTLTVITAGRGRGKSSALGLALAGLPETRAVALCGPSPESIAEVQRFAGRALEVFEPLALARAEPREGVVVVDEAAQVPVPVLREILARHPRAHLAFATTTHGYEGTGRGFVLRFLAELEREARPLARHTLTTPIRYAEADALEQAVVDLLLLEASPSVVEASGDYRAEAIERSALAEDEALLRAAFGLLVHAHYRTTPRDLLQLLDAPNMRLHVLRDGGSVAAASIVAREGGLAEDTVRALASGQRLRGQALPETLVCHSGALEAGALRWVRSVRIAVHPAARRRGLAGRLVESIHAHYEADGFGTLFGATPELLRFRRSLGYRLVRVGASRGGRTGEPSAVMLRPVSERASRLVETLRAELARDLPLQRELAAVDVPLPREAAFEEALRLDLPAPRALSEEERDRIVQAYAHGPRTYEASAVALAAWLEGRPRNTRSAAERRLLAARVERRESWTDCAVAAGVQGPRAAMRLLKRAVRALYQESNG